MLIVLGSASFFFFLSGKWIGFEERMNEPLRRTLEEQEHNPVYQNSYCRIGHPEHPCSLWICPRCSYCQYQKTQENRYLLHGQGKMG